MNQWKVAFFASIALTLLGCSKHESPPATASGAPPAAPVAPAASQPAATNAAAPAAASAPAEDPEALAKRQKIEYALNEEKIATDPHGQWASEATASTTYQDAKANENYAANQATGAPNVIGYGDNPQAWAPKEADAGIEWLQVGFVKPVNATGIRIRQNVGGGAIIKVELLDDKGDRHTIFEGSDAEKYDEYHQWFTRTFDKTAYVVKGAKITLATNAVSGWNEIDAVQLLSE
jgi:hypothetical protein